MFGLLDIDGHGGFPNLALMKIASYYKGRVEWAMPMFGDYETIFASKVFTFSPEPNWNEYNYRVLEKGGTGYDIAKKLPPPLKKYLHQTIRYIRIATIRFNSILAVASDIAPSAWFMKRKEI